MKNYLIGVLLLSAPPIFGQATAEKILQSVITIDDARQFISSHPTLHSTLHVLNSLHDTTAADQQLYKRNKGDIITIRGESYKIIEDTAKYIFRVSYIYLDGSHLSHLAIDSMRTLILKRYAAGISFERLADEYTMDNNPNHGDLGFFDPAMMVREFSDAVRQHANGDIFTVDVPGNQWYYVVKKTADDRVIMETTVLEVKGI